MVNVITEIIINCPKIHVADYAANPDHAPVWYDNINSSDWKTPKPLQLGSQIAFRARFLGKDLAYIYEIVEFIPGEKLTMKTAQGPFPMETTYTWAAIDSNTTKMTLQNKGEPKGFSKLFSPVMATMMRKANEKDLKKIKEILEK
ncbi:SRPBCC family protein [Sutcliffiella horikoshii]|uniref:SRPBCC family protein n=1 Tax=Sutcliffiella horikoshii TaxID=79883 RepID=UPI003CF3D623